MPVCLQFFFRLCSRSLRFTHVSCFGFSLFGVFFLVFLWHFCLLIALILLSLLLPFRLCFLLEQEEEANSKEEKGQVLLVVAMHPAQDGLFLLFLPLQCFHLVHLVWAFLSVWESVLGSICWANLLHQCRLIIMHLSRLRSRQLPRLFLSLHLCLLPFPFLTPHHLPPHLLPQQQLGRTLTQST